MGVACDHVSRKSWNLKFLGVRNKIVEKLNWSTHISLIKIKMVR